MFKRINALLASFLLSFASLLVLAPTAHAATITWTGGGVNGNWSTAANWLGGVVPVSGDSVIINNAATFVSSASTNDIPGLSLVSISFTNNSPSSSIISVLLQESITLTSAITQLATVTTTTNNIAGVGGIKAITLGGNVTVTSTTGLGLGNPGDDINLGANTLTFTDNGGPTSNITSVRSDISGSGSVAYNGPATNYQISGNNTYSGPTQITETNLPLSHSGNFNPFGTSAVTIETGASVNFSYASNTTISNVITVAGAISGSPVTSLSFSSSGTGTTFSVPNIILNGSTRFSNSNPAGDLTVNLAGINANGNCVQYLGPGASTTDGPSNGFVNGPPGCIVDAPVTSAVAPSAPNTGFTLIKNNPAVTLLVTSLLAASIALLARRYSRITNR